MEFDEASERKYLEILIGLLLERAFADSLEFEHQCMSPGEALSRCLKNLGVAEDDGWTLRLKMPTDWVRNKVRLLSLQNLPALGDVLEVMLSFESQYGTFPRDYRSGERVQFAPDLSTLLRQMGMLGVRGIPNDHLLLIMVNHYILKPANGVWDSTVEPLLKDLAERTLDRAPTEFTDILRGRSERPLTWAEGYLNVHWRYGEWLSDRQLARAMTQHHTALPHIITHTLADGGKRIYVPPNFRQ